MDKEGSFLRDLEKDPDNLCANCERRLYSIVDNDGTKVCGVCRFISFINMTKFRARIRDIKNRRKNITPKIDGATEERWALRNADPDKPRYVRAKKKLKKAKEAGE